MKTIIEGHLYELGNFVNENGPGQQLQFIHKQELDDDRGGLMKVTDGTTNEEVIEMMIDRSVSLNNKFPCEENVNAIASLKSALMWFRKRTADRQKRGVEGKQLA